LRLCSSSGCADAAYNFSRRPSSWRGGWELDAKELSKDDVWGESSAWSADGRRPKKRPPLDDGLPEDEGRGVREFEYPSRDYNRWEVLA